jgi:hypothetical protein
VMLCRFLKFCIQQSTVVSENIQRLSDSHTALLILTHMFLYLNLCVYIVTTVWDSRIGRRNRERPRRRWVQEFREVVGNQWSRIARGRGKWKDTFLDIN